MENRFWKLLCEHLGVPEYAPLQYDENHRIEVIDFMRTAFKQKTLAEWEAELADLDVCWSPIRNLSEVLQDPFFREREMVVEINETNGETTKILGVPAKLSATPGSIRSAPVGFGESTTAILRELGYTRDQIKDFVEKGVC